MSYDFLIIVGQLGVILWGVYLLSIHFFRENY